jgi:DNA-3-methyladenine glycosylase
LIIPQSFYLRDDVVRIAKDLLGKYLVTQFDGKITSGIIVETEAYSGLNDKASHAFGGRFTKRTKIMYRQGGTAYVYLCYGVHSLFNIVTNKSGIADAVLIRGIIPAEGLDVMLNRAGKPKTTAKMGLGPGKVSRLLGIHFSATGSPVTFLEEDKPPIKPFIWVEDRGNIVTDSEIMASPRVGVDYAGEDAKLPWRFCLKKKCPSEKEHF